MSHQAAQLEISRCIDDPEFDLKCNTVGTLNVLRAAIRNHVSKVINASSACVYGQAFSMPQSERNHPTNPNWAYGVSKLAAEKYCQIFSAMYKIPVISFRYSIVYGPREWYGRVLTIFLKRVLERSSPIVFGSGSELRDFVYVGDLVRAHRYAMEAQFSEAHSVNVSTGKGTSILELAKKVVRLADVPLQPLREDVPVGGWSSIVDRQRLPAELERMVLDNALAKTLLGWEPKVMLDEGLKMEFAWLQENPHRWRDVAVRI